MHKYGAGTPYVTGRLEMDGIWQVIPVVTVLGHLSGTAVSHWSMAAQARMSSRFFLVFSPRPSSLLTGSSKHGMLGFKLPLERIVVTCHTRTVTFLHDIDSPLLW